MPMKTSKWADIAFIACFVAMCIAPGVWMLVEEWQSISTSENRRLYEFPKVTGRSLSDIVENVPREVDSALRDHFGFREALVWVYNVIHAIGLNSSTNPALIVLNDEWSADMPHLPDSMPRYLSELAPVLRQNRELLGNVNTLYVPLLLPRKHLVYSDLMDPTFGLDAINRGIDTSLTTLNQPPVSVEIFDLRGPLRERRRRGDVFFRHDIHWNAHGAHAAYAAIMRFLESKRHELAGRTLDEQEYPFPEGRVIGGHALMLGIGAMWEETAPLYVDPRPECGKQATMYRPGHEAGKYEALFKAHRVVEIAEMENPCGFPATVWIIGRSFFISYFSSSETMGFSRYFSDSFRNVTSIWYPQDRRTDVYKALLASGVTPPDIVLEEVIAE